MIRSTSAPSFCSLSREENRGSNVAPVHDGVADGARPRAAPTHIPFARSLVAEELRAP